MRSPVAMPALAWKAYPAVRASDRNPDRGEPDLLSGRGYQPDFIAHNPNYPYIVYNGGPKVEALRRLFPANWR